MGVFGSEGEEFMLKALFGLTAPFTLDGSNLHVLATSQLATNLTQATSTYKIAELDNFSNWAWDSALDPSGNSEAGGIKNTADIVMTASAAGTATHIAIVDETANKLLVAASLGSTHTVASGDTLTIASGQLQIEID